MEVLHYIKIITKQTQKQFELQNKRRERDREEGGRGEGWKRKGRDGAAHPYTNEVDIQENKPLYTHI